ncbi:phenylacetate-CoA oxygenase subunit PaaJ [Ornithinimicrobium faecis]|uniref:Phenylacetate-CoA oxygenase subunit PaaJ n=1 Tax=Ornithinimicrobium faecis TaxID=2934158 RepID=A0ABY4YQ35_9MICO|nr:1,2-phenylacetyl-CoA epoxidase subunit PaaD [Ornithinimicrobium sp. HY1793]USQ78892.1 phenylacetate-CoA oxygenase subunit PaaJ [Ornithinimicrobium sp. HY1793]
MTVVTGIEAAIRDIPDPEIPVISIDDLGIVRDITVEDGTVHVTITPTYSGCPAVQAITDHIKHTVRAHGLVPDVVTTLSPAWTTDWMSEQGRESLRRFGIAPPSGSGPARPSGPVVVDLSVRQVVCPSCGSADTEELSRFGSTACKALRRCRSCREPFEEFKAT